ncbi:50S ribosomal protein L24e [Candidatus Woesearchaeota archaeon]|nr:50S ribosomal protein L24e [Candidatus Woesearchaeota archaeon]
MAICSFCKCNIPRGTGKILVLRSGKILNFCSNKCEKNLIKLKRKPTFFKWTGAYEKGLKKEIEK